MEKLRPRHFAIVLVLTTVVGWSSALQEDDQWAMENYEELLDTLIPLRLEPAISMKTRWRAVARIIPPYDTEFYAVLQRDWDGVTELHVTILSEPLRAQMKALKRETPNATVATLAPQVKVSKYSADSKHCSYVHELARKLEKLKLHGLPHDALYVHASRYELRVEQTYRTETVVMLTGPNNGRGTDPVIRWIESLRPRLDGCKARR